MSDLEHEREEPAGCEFSQRPQREEFRIRVVVRGVFERQIEVVKRPDGFRTPKLEKFPSLKFRTVTQPILLFFLAEKSSKKHDLNDNKPYKKAKYTCCAL